MELACIPLLYHSYLHTSKTMRKISVVGFEKCFLKKFYLKNFGFLWQLQVVPKIEDCINCISSALSKTYKSLLPQHKNKEPGYKSTDFFLRCTYSKKNSSLKTRFLFQWWWFFILFVSFRIPHVRQFFYIFLSSRK